MASQRNILVKIIIVIEFTIKIDAWELMTPKCQMGYISSKQIQ